MAESVLWPTCRLLIIDCHERHVGPFGPSTNVVCQLCPGNSLCMLLESVASWPRTIAPRAEGKLYRATPPFGRMKTYFYPPTALCTQTCSWPADIFRFFAGYILSALLAMHSLYQLTVEPATSLFWLGTKRKKSKWEHIEKLLCVRIEAKIPIPVPIASSLSLTIFMVLVVCLAS